MNHEPYHFCTYGQMPDILYGSYNYRNLKKIYGLFLMGHVFLMTSLSSYQFLEQICILSSNLGVCGNNLGETRYSEITGEIIL
jgi:hypothetical protein